MIDTMYTTTVKARLLAIGWVAAALCGGALADPPGQGSVGAVEATALVEVQANPIAATNTADAGPGALYRIDTGDKVSIRVFDEPELAVLDQHIEGSGTMTMPLIGVLQVRGLTADELEALVTEKLADGYLKHPQVSVSIDRYRLYFIKGEVRRPGGYSFVEGLTVQKAVALAGGFTERASERKISIVRDLNPDEPLSRVKPQTPIYPGDVITVGESFF